MRDLAFVRALSSRRVSKTSFPSVKFADSVATGYQATYTSDAAHRSGRLADLVPVIVPGLSSGTLQFAFSRVASSGITPAYPISNSTTPCGNSSCGRVTTASDKFPRWYRCRRCRAGR